jgi:hypothetical protein
MRQRRPPRPHPDFTLKVAPDQFTTRTLAHGAHPSPFAAASGIDSADRPPCTRPGVVRSEGRLVHPAVTSSGAIRPLLVSSLV